MKWSGKTEVISVSRATYFMCNTHNFSFPLCVHSTQNCCFEFSINVLQHNMTSAQIISRYFTHKNCTEKFRMNYSPMLKINEHSAWYQNVWILAVTGRFPVEYVLVCCTLYTPVQSTKSVCEFEIQIFCAGGWYMLWFW